MRLMRVGPAGQERPALLDTQSQLRDLSAHCPDIGGATPPGEDPDEQQQRTAPA